MCPRSYVGCSVSMVHILRIFTTNSIPLTNQLQNKHSHFISTFTHSTVATSEWARGILIWLTSMGRFSLKSQQKNEWFSLWSKWKKFDIESHIASFLISQKYLINFYRLRKSKPGRFLLWNSNASSFHNHFFFTGLQQFVLSFRMFSFKNVQKCHNKVHCLQNSFLSFD